MPRVKSKYQTSLFWVVIIVVPISFILALGLQKYSRYNRPQCEFNDSPLVGLAYCDRYQISGWPFSFNSEKPTYDLYLYDSVDQYEEVAAKYNTDRQSNLVLNFIAYTLALLGTYVAMKPLAEHYLKGKRQ